MDNLCTCGDTAARHDRFAACTRPDCECRDFTPTHDTAVAEAVGVLTEGEVR